MAVNFSVSFKFTGYLLKVACLEKQLMIALDIGTGV